MPRRNPCEPGASVLVRVHRADLVSMDLAGIAASAEIPGTQREAELCDAIAQIVDLIESMQRFGLHNAAGVLAERAIQIGVDAAMDDSLFTHQEMQREQRKASKRDQARPDAAAGRSRRQVRPRSRSA